MFDRIARRYDFLNHVLSGGCDWLWRRRLARAVAAGSHERILDLATGTGDQLLALARACPHLTLGVGIDVAGEMLRVGLGKLPPAADGPVLSLVRGDAMHLPLTDGPVDVATISFGIRNVERPAAGLREMHRVVRPGGRVMVLEFGLPVNRLLRRLYLLYFRHVLPWIGGILSGDRRAYVYLNRTVETFPFGEEFAAMMRQAGFVDVRLTPLTFGIAWLYEGTRPTS